MKFQSLVLSLVLLGTCAGQAHAQVAAQKKTDSSMQDKTHGSVNNLASPKDSADGLEADDLKDMKRAEGAWSEWHQKVEEQISRRFNKLAKEQSLPPSNTSECQVAFTITREHQISDIHLVQKSPNMFLNTMAFIVIKSMNGSPELEFPSGTSRTTVEKVLTFFWTGSPDDDKKQIKIKNGATKGDASADASESSQEDKRPTSPSNDGGSPGSAPKEVQNPEKHSNQSK